MATYEYHFRPQGRVLSEYIASRARVTLIMGPLGSAKTNASCQKLFNFMCEQEPHNGARYTRFYAVRNTYPDLFSTTIKDWLDMFGGLGKFNKGGLEPPTHRLYFLLDDGTKVQSEVIFLAMDRDEHVKKLRGAQATGFWLNETKELQKSTIDMADGRHGRYPSKAIGGPSWHGMIGDYNAPDDDHWLYQLAEEEKPEDWVFLRQPGGVIKTGTLPNGKAVWEPNPNAENLHNLPDGYYPKMLAGKDDSWITVNLANDYGTLVEGLPVYQSQWNNLLHVSTDELWPIKSQPLYLGWDFGLTPSLIIAQRTTRGQLRILEEVIGEDCGIEEFVENYVDPLMSEKYQGLKFISVGDPAGEQGSQIRKKDTVLKELKRLGYPTEKAPSNSTKLRLDAVKWFLNRMAGGQPAFLLDSKCKVLRKGFNTGYRYRKLKIAGEAKYTLEPDKNKFSHPHDALQYICLLIKSGYNKEQSQQTTHVPQARVHIADPVAGY